MLTMREVQHQTGLSYPAIKRRIDNGTIHAVKEGNKYLIDESELSKLPKPRNTGVQETTQKAEVPQVVPFTAEQMIEMRRLKLAEYLLMGKTLTPQLV